MWKTASLRRGDAECVKNDQYAVQRVLEVVRGEDGKFYLLLEYLGYRYLSRSKVGESTSGQEL